MDAKANDGSVKSIINTGGESHVVCGGGDGTCGDDGVGQCEDDGDGRCGDDGDGACGSDISPADRVNEEDRVNGEDRVDGEERVDVSLPVKFNKYYHENLTKLNIQIVEKFDDLVRT